MVLEGHMKIVKGALFVILMVALAVGAFNLLFVAVSDYFGPFYESEADQRRNFAIWLLGNAGGGCFRLLWGLFCIGVICAEHVLERHDGRRPDAISATAITL
jgi:hypothetical protein